MTQVIHFFILDFFSVAHCRKFFIFKRKLSISAGSFPCEQYSDFSNYVSFLPIKVNLMVRATVRLSKQKSNFIYREKGSIEYLGSIMICTTVRALHCLFHLVVL